MFPVKFIKVDPSHYIFQYKRGRVVREGAGLSFFCFAPSTSLVRVPISSADVPFIFREVTADFQEVTVQGQLSYRVSDPGRLSGLMNFTLTSAGDSYATDDPLKLPQRLVNHTQVLTRASLKSLTLREALGQSEGLVNSLLSGLQTAGTITSLGVEVLGLSILAIKPTSETARALEAEAREQILLKADEAIYVRRNAAVEQERSIKENELNTEIAVENKKRQIREAQMEAEKSVQQKKRELQEAEMSTEISIERMNRELVALSAANDREESDARAYALSAVVKSLADTDPKTVQALAGIGMDAGKLVALAFRDLADSTDRIGQLNISPDLLRELLAKGSGN